jgi:hypothetical protein
LSVPWKTLERSMEELFSHRMEAFTEEQLVNMRTVSRMRYAEDNAKRLHPLKTLIRFAHFDCADPRDRLYALYGIFQHGLSGSAGWVHIGEIDYTLSTEDLFTNFTTSMIQLAEDTPTARSVSYVLQLATAFRPRPPRPHLMLGARKGMPSWDVDWTGALHFEPLRDIYSFSRIWSGVHAPSGRPGQRAEAIQYRNGRKLLVLTGIFLDTVSAVVPIDVQALNTVSGCAHFAKAAINDLLHAFAWNLDNTDFPSRAQKNCYLYTQEHLMVAVARSLVADWHYVPGHSYFSQDRRFRHQFLAKLADSGFSLPEILHKWPAYVELVALTMRGRSLFMTEGGLIGISADDTNLGDTVCIFEGSSVPFMLRANGEPLTWTSMACPESAYYDSQLNNDPETFPTFQLVSDAYVYGIFPEGHKSFYTSGDGNGVQDLPKRYQDREMMTFYIQ